MFGIEINLNDFDHQQVGPMVVSTTWFLTNGHYNLRDSITWKSTHKNPPRGGKNKFARLPPYICLSGMFTSAISLLLHTTVYLQTWLLLLFFFLCPWSDMGWVLGLGLQILGEICITRYSVVRKKNVKKECDLIKVVLLRTL